MAFMPRSRETILRFLVGAIALPACNQGLTNAENAEAAAESESETAPETETDSSTFLVTTEGDVIGGGGDACDPFLQDCPVGEKCVPFASSGVTWDANHCVPVTGDGQLGDTCTSNDVALGTDDCGPDSLCWDTMDVEGEQVGVCTPFCTGSANDPICEPGRSCVIVNEGSINLCIATCDPLLQECGDGLGCFWTSGNFNCVFWTDGIPTGEPCGYINDCAPGNFCADASALPICAGSACCASYCDQLAPVCEQAGTECVTFFEEGLAPPGHENVGVCVLPG